MECFDDHPKVIGTKQTLKALKEGRARLVILAADTKEDLKCEIEAACQAAGVTVEAYESRQALGQACKIERAAAVVTLLKAD